jgi:hypothetical protein
MVEARTREYRLAPAAAAEEFRNGEAAEVRVREGKCV